MPDIGIPDSSKATAYLVPAVDRALYVLELLATARDGYNLSDLAARLDLPKSSLHNILHTLSEHHFVRCDRLGNWALGPRAHEVGVAYGAYRDLVGAFREVARAIVSSCGETVQMAVLDGREAVYIAKVEGTESVRLVSREGARLPAHATALGKALLATLPTAELACLYRDATWPRLAPRTIVTFEALLAELALTRARGYAVDNEEVAEGLQCLACAVYDDQSQAVAAISVSVPSYRLPEARCRELQELIGRGAADLSSRIGYHVIASPR